MYCYTCKCYFDQPITIMESRGEYFGFPAAEPTDACPRCRSTNIEYDKEEKIIDYEE